MRHELGSEWAATLPAASTPELPPLLEDDLLDQLERLCARRGRAPLERQEEGANRRVTLRYPLPDLPLASGEATGPQQNWDELHLRHPFVAEPVGELRSCRTQGARR